MAQPLPLFAVYRATRAVKQEGERCSSRRDLINLTGSARLALQNKAGAS